MKICGVEFEHLTLSDEQVLLGEVERIVNETVAVDDKTGNGFKAALGVLNRFFESGRISEKNFLSAETFVLRTQGAQ